MQPLDPLTVPLTGTRLIEASAGTGKTFAITTLYVRLIVERGLRVDEILVVTYTRAATAELRDRVRLRLRQALTALDRGGAPRDPDLDALVRARLASGSEASDRLRLLAALRAFDQAAIYTIHSFCQRTLQLSAFESGTAFDLEFMTDQGPLVTQIALDFWARELYQAPEVFVASLMRPVKPLTPTTLIGLARKAIDNRAMPILPPRPEIDAAAGARWSAARANAAAIWAEQRDDIIDLLAGSSALKANMYKEANIRAKWAPALDAMFAPGSTGAPIDFEALYKFSEAGIARGCKKGKQAPSHPLFALCREMVEVTEGFPARELALLLDCMEYARSEIQTRKAAASTQSFDDLLYELRDALRGPGGTPLASAMRLRYRAALIDEFQDTDPVQYEVFRRVYQQADPAEELGLFLIGDPKQAIYAFRGADVFTYMTARQDAGANSNTLATNWRSDPSLVGAVNTLFSRARTPFIFDGIEFTPVAPRPGAEDGLGGDLDGAAPLQLLFVPREGRENKEGSINKSMATDELPEAIAGNIATLLNGSATLHGKPVTPADIAVLCRTNVQATDMQRALRGVAVPSVVEGDASVFDHEPAEALERVLLAMAEPGNTRAIKAALATELMGVSGDGVHALQADEEAWDGWLQKFRDWQQIWNEQGFVQAFRRMITDHDVDRRLLALVDGERRLTNLYHLGELLQAEVMTSRAGPQALLRWFELMRTDRAARADAVGDSAQIRLESDADAVKLVTIHKSKGLEYPIVYCPFLWDGKLLRGDDAKWIRFHDPDDEDRLKLDLGGDDLAAHEALAKREALAESLRLLYVALTRARYLCTFVWGGFRDAGSSPLAYLLHQPDQFSTDPDGLERFASQVEEMSDEELIADLEELVHAADGAIALDYFAPVPVPPFAPAATTAGSLACREAKRKLEAIGRLSSFSALASTELSERVRDQAHDHDADHESTAAPMPEAAASPEAPVTQVPLHDFPRGARVGQMFHHMLETIDFCDPDPQVVSAAATASLSRFGLDASLAAQVAPAISGVLATPLPGTEATLTLADLPGEQRLVELEFQFPVADSSPALTPSALARAFRTRDDAPWPAGYPDRLAELGFAPLAGFLRGFADLVFVHDERWYLVDYKSNFLGPTPGDYAPARLLAPMASHHYFLQYNIYLVALHRYLGLRLRGYDYERHFGGVYYLFLRGMAASHPSGCGVFHDRPPAGFVEVLSSLVGEPTRLGGRA